MKARFVLTPQAQNDLREILLTIAAENPRAAERVRLALYASFQRLAHSPGIGHFHDELLDRRYRFWNFYSYVVCYAWEQKPIRIIAVVHGARHLDALLPKRSQV